MKKHYILLAVVITSLILAMFGGVGVWYTYETATNIMNDKWLDVIDYEWELMTDSIWTGSKYDAGVYSGIDSNRDVISDLYDDFEFNSTQKSDDIGYYQMYIRDDGEKIESGSHLEITCLTYDEDGTGVCEEIRYIPAGPDLKYNTYKVWNNIKIDAMCDDKFIFNGTIESYDNSDDNFEYTIGENKFASDEKAIQVNEWLKQVDLAREPEAKYYAIAETKYEKKLCDEAKKKLEDTIAETEKDSWFKEYRNGEYYYYSISYSTDKNEILGYSEYYWVPDDAKVVVHAQKELGTSFYITHAAINSYTDNTYAIYLFHPLELAFRNNMKIYIISLIVLIILEVLVVFFIRKLYRNGRDYELMRQGLTRSIAHDLKTPLAITKAYVENWEYIDDADRHEYAEKLNSEVDNMTYIINTMLNMSKFDLKKNIKLEEVNIYSMAMAIYERMNPIISERNLDVRIYTDNEDGDYYVYADPKMIRIVINNFITNAVKYARSTIYMEFYRHKKKIKFVIGNDGTTISKKDIKKIWEPFYKADKTRTDRIGSSGMGLAINKSILKLHKAKFKCTSNAGRTTFSFEMKKVGNNGE